MLNNTYAPVLVNIDLYSFKYEEDYNSESGEEYGYESSGDQTFQVTLTNPCEIELLEAMAYNFAKMAGLDSDYCVEYYLPAHKLLFTDDKSFIEWFNNSLYKNVPTQEAKELCSNSSTL